ncbi:MAG TPA: class I SAM-dependent methyltransferase [Bacteroidales bacterium]|nr:class I SAM-dependent methyltransferase [Bacteroidales bacterium]HNS45956.1 class I SAM-dependent methyltransferase [Bacteroidales bacterium]
MNTISNCPVCQSPDLHPYLEVRDLFLTNETFVIRICPNCGCGITDPRPTAEEIARYYQSRSYISHSASSKGLLNKLYLIARNYTLWKKYNLIRTQSRQSPGTILDIGCGSGDFLGYFQKRKWETLGIEPDEPTRQAAMRNYPLHIGGSELFTQIPTRSHHVITLWHSLEHIAGLHETFAQVKRILRPDGVLFIAVPNYTSRDAAFYGPYWAAWDVPRHLVHFTPQTMDRLVRQYGLKIQCSLPMKLDAYYISMLSERYQHGRVNYLRAIRNGWRSNRYARSHENTFSSLIYVIKPENA